MDFVLDREEAVPPDSLGALVLVMGTYGGMYYIKM